jgi:hypothetical protein
MKNYTLSIEENNGFNVFELLGYYTHKPLKVHLKLRNPN